MIDPVDELLRSGNTEPLSELYEAVAEVVALIEDLENDSDAQHLTPQPMVDMITAFNACEIAVIEFRKRIAAKASDGDTKPAELTGSAGVRR